MDNNLTDEKTIEETVQKELKIKLEELEKDMQIQLNDITRKLNERFSIDLNEKMKKFKEDKEEEFNKKLLDIQKENKSQLFEKSERLEKEYDIMLKTKLQLSIKDKNKDFNFTIEELDEIKNQKETINQLLYPRAGKVDFYKASHRRNIEGKDNKFISKPIRFTEDTMESKIDKRILIKDNLIQEWPYCSIGQIQYCIGNGNYYATAFLIGHRAILTCAHNIYNSSKQTAQGIVFIPCLDGKKITSKSEVELVFIPEEFKSNPMNSAEDYAVLILKQPLNAYGYFGLFNQQYDILKQEVFSIYGYPYDKIKELVFEAHYEMWGQRGKLTDYDKVSNHFRYAEIFTNYGQDGSPIFFKYNGGYYACGIHLQEDYGNGRGLHFTKERLINIMMWAGICSPILYLGWSNLTDYGIEYLTNFNLTEVQKLFLYGNKISDKGVILLSKMNMPKLNELSLYGNKISDEGKSILNNRFPNTGIFY